MTIQDMLEDPECRDLGLQIKGRLIQIVRSYLAAGILNFDELLSDEVCVYLGLKESKFNLILCN